MYYIVFALFYLFSLLPFFILYIISDGLAFLLYAVIRYRRTVVAANLAIAFPEKTLPERKKIEKQFYRNFTDNWMESIKLLSISEKDILKRISYDFGAVDEIFLTGRCCDIFLGHQFNWELGNVIVPLRTSFKVMVAYSPLSNKILDRLFLHIRQRFGCIMLPFNDMRRAMLPHRHTQYILGLVADQTPPIPSKSYWLHFLNKPTAFLKGPEKGARIGNVPVVFMAFTRPKRGYYKLQASLLFKDPANTVEGEVTKKYAAVLEENIRMHPELYLWSHKRWKHPWHEAYKHLWIDSSVPAPTT